MLVIFKVRVHTVHGKCWCVNLHSLKKGEAQTSKLRVCTVCIMCFEVASKYSFPLRKICKENMRCAGVPLVPEAILGDTIDRSGERGVLPPPVNDLERQVLWSKALH